MVRTMSAQEVRAKLGDVLGSVSATQEPVIVEEHGHPMAVVICLEDFRRLSVLDPRRAAAISAFAAFGERFKDVPEEDIEREVAAAVAAVRSENRQREQQAPDRAT